MAGFCRVRKRGFLPGKARPVACNRQPAEDCANSPKKTDKKMSDSLKPAPKMKDRLESLVVEMIERGILFSEATAQFEKQFIQRSLKLNDNNITRAAEAIGLHRNTLSHKIKRYQL
jgi:DNA-binding NtrC family response regulator